MTVKFWAVGRNFDYDITVIEPNPMEWPISEGPFECLNEAKETARMWIRGDRNWLTDELMNINEWKLEEESP